MTATTTDRRRLIVRASRLGWFTIGWNLVEAVVALTAAAVAGSRALIGFGADSLVESLSATVVLWRLSVERRDPETAERVEQRALRLIGITFLVLASYVAFEAMRSLATSEQPDSAPVGIVVTAVSLVVMPVLAWRKRIVGVAMDSRAVQADSAQTRACAYLSAVVLGGLVLNAGLGWWWADPIAALVVVALLVREGRDALTAEALDDCC